MLLFFCAVLGIFRHLADHVVEDSSVVEICQLHVSVEPHPHLECFPCVKLSKAERDIKCHIM